MFPSPKLASLLRTLDTQCLIAAQLASMAKPNGEALFLSFAFLFSLFLSFVHSVLYPICLAWGVVLLGRTSQSLAQPKNQAWSCLGGYWRGIWVEGIG